MLRPGRWLALLTRSFTFELSPRRSPAHGVEYDYVGKQPIPTAGLAPASLVALWAALSDHSCCRECSDTISLPARGFGLPWFVVFPRWRVGLTGRWRFAARSLAGASG